MPQRLSTAADICRLVLLTTALSLLWSVEDVFCEPESGCPRKDHADTEHTSL